MVPVTRDKFGAEGQARTVLVPYSDLVWYVYITMRGIILLDMQSFYRLDQLLISSGNSVTLLEHEYQYRLPC